VEKKLQNGILAQHFTRVVREDSDEHALCGILKRDCISTDQGANWQSFQMDTYSSRYGPSKNDNLIIATLGRSLWIHDDLNLVDGLFFKFALKSSSRRSREPPEENQSKLFAPKPSYRMADAPGGANEYRRC
jgi:hypothetical protein